MSQASRKIASESLLRQRGIPVNEHLPLIESDEEVALRSNEEIVRRLVALWAVVGRAMLREKSEFREYIESHGLQTWLSDAERQFLLDPNPTERDFVQFSWRLEALSFLAWCAGLHEMELIPADQSSVEPILPLFPGATELPDRLRASVRVRRKSEILDRADLLYRLHWAVRDATLRGEPPPSDVQAGVVQEWHQAANWVIRYDEEDNWDHVGTDT